MSGSVLRRLTKLEASMQPDDAPDLAAQITAGRKRAQSMTPAELQAEGMARLAGMRSRHAERPLRGLELEMMHGLKRMLATGAAA